MEYTLQAKGTKMNEKPDQTWTKQELYQYAKEHKINVSKNLKKDEILKKINSFQEKEIVTETKGKKDHIKEGDTKKEEDTVQIVEKGEYIPKQKPELDSATIQKITHRNKTKKRFYRQEWFRYKRLGKKWRRPKGRHSKMRKNLKYRPPKVKIGYRTPTEIRGLHPSGYQDVLITTPQELEKLDPKTQAARIAHSVGGKKREEIEDKANNLGIRILNRRKK
jgi:large subunit ribosomal protein L32e